MLITAAFNKFLRGIIALCVFFFVRIEGLLDFLLKPTKMKKADGWT